MHKKWLYCYEIQLVQKVISNLKPEVRVLQRNQGKNQYDKKLLVPILKERLRGFEGGIPNGVDLSYPIKEIESE